MKVWIIVLFIIAIVSELVSRLCVIYIKNDAEERTKYVIYRGATTLGAVCGLCRLIAILSFAADVILFLILILDKI